MTVDETPVSPPTAVPATVAETKKKEPTADLRECSF
jgi:hypothetical protein